MVGTKLIPIQLNGVAPRLTANSNSGERCTARRPSGAGPLKNVPGASLLPNVTSQVCVTQTSIFPTSCVLMTLHRLLMSRGTVISWKCSAHDCLPQWTQVSTCYRITNSTEHSPSSEADSSSASQEIPAIYENWTFITVFIKIRPWSLSWASSRPHSLHVQDPVEHYQPIYAQVSKVVPSFQVSSPQP